MCGRGSTIKVKLLQQCGLALTMTLSPRPIDPLPLLFHSHYNLDPEPPPKT